MGGTESKIAQKTDIEKTAVHRPVLVSPPEHPDQGNEKLNIEPDQPGSESSEEEEKESYKDWVSTGTRSTTSGCRNSSLELREASGGECGASHTHTHSSNPSDDAPSSTGWLGQCPSTDTPLHHPGDLHMKTSTAPVSGPAAHTAPLPRTSNSSTGGDNVTLSPAASARSSFALERASLEANRASLEAFNHAFKPHAAVGQAAPPRASDAQVYDELEHAAAAMTLDVLMKMAGIPGGTRDQYAMLGVLPLQTPAPSGMLGLLWGMNEEQVGAVLSMLASRGVVNVARLPTGHVWALPQPQHLQLLQDACKAELPGYHARLVAAYAACQAGTVDCGTARGLAAALASRPDDGYFVANIAHHLVAAGRMDAARELLFDLGWLERKLRACGPAAVVADFRRYLLARSEREVKLLLEAFQMSVGLVQTHPELSGLLSTLVSARLMTVPLSPGMAGRLEEQRTRQRAATAAAAAARRPRPLPPHTPSLDQAGGLQRLTLKGHRGAVPVLLLTPSGTEAVSGGADGSARVWDLEIGDCTLVMEGHAGPITGLAITADGSLLVSCSEDGTARAFEMEQGQCLRVLAGHVGTINALMVDPQGRFVVTAGEDGTVRVWDLASAKALHVLSAPGGACAVALSPCGRFVLAGCADGSCRMFNVSTGQSMGCMTGHTRWVSVVAFLPDGKHAVSASHDGTMRTWSLRSGRCSAVAKGHSGRINALALSADGSIAATAGDDCTARVWDVRTGACRRVLQGHAAWVSHVALSPAGDRLVTASADSTAIAWAVDSGEVVRVLEGHSGVVLGAAVTRRGRFAVTAAEDGSVRVWDFSASTGHTPRWHEGRIRALAGRDGKVVATSGDDCLARLWDSALGEYRGLIKGHVVPIRWVQFSADGSRLVTASPDRQVCVWDCNTTELLHQLPVNQGSRMKSFAASADLSTAVICLFDSTVTIWDLPTAQPTLQLQRWGDRDATRGHSSAVNEVMMTADGSTVITLSKDFTSRVWDASTGVCRHVLEGHTDPVVGGCLSEEGRLVATYSHDGTARLWSLDGGPALAVVRLPQLVTKMTLAPGGCRMAAALVDGTVILADLKAAGGECVLVEGHKEEVTDLGFSADGQLLVTCSMDCTARLVSAKDGVTEGVFVSDCGLTCCHYDSVTECIIAGTDRGVVHFVDASK